MDGHVCKLDKQATKPFFWVHNQYLDGVGEGRRQELKTYQWARCELDCNTTGKQRQVVKVWKVCSSYLRVWNVPDDVKAAHLDVSLHSRTICVEATLLNVKPRWAQHRGGMDSLRLPQVRTKILSGILIIAIRKNKYILTCMIMSEGVLFYLSIFSYQEGLKTDQFENRSTNSQTSQYNYYFF